MSTAIPGEEASIQTMRELSFDDGDEDDDGEADDSPSSALPPYLFSTTASNGKASPLLAMTISSLNIGSEYQPSPIHVYCALY
jgi:hypothetical protein